MTELPIMKDVGKGKRNYVGTLNNDVCRMAEWHKIKKNRANMLAFGKFYYLCNRKRYSLARSKLARTNVFSSFLIR